MNKLTKMNKGTGKQYVAVFVTHYNSSLSSFVSFRILSQVVAEKSLTEKIQTDKQTTIITEKTKHYFPH